MELRQIEDGKVTVELNPDDCARLAAACETAAAVADGGSSPSPDTRARLTAGGVNEGMYTALAAAFEAAGLAASVLFAMPIEKIAAHTLAAERGRGPTWYATPVDIRQTRGEDDGPGTPA